MAKCAVLNVPLMAKCALQSLYRDTVLNEPLMAKCAVLNVPLMAKCALQSLYRDTVLNEPLMAKCALQSLWAIPGKCQPKGEKFKVGLECALIPQFQAK